MSPEWTLIALNAVLIGIAYAAVYPRYAEKDVGRLMRGDLVVTGIALMLAGLLFAGSGTRFGLVLFDTNWVVFSLVSFVVIETPVFLAYCRWQGIPLSTFDVLPGPDRDRSDD